MKHIAVIGAGMAGAGAARKLQAAGHRVTVFERSSHVGGRTRTHRGPGFHANTGAGFFTNFYPHFSKLIQELQLESQILENPKEVSLADGNRSYRYRLDSVPSFFGIPFLSFWEKMRLLGLTLSLTLKKKRLPLTNPHALAPFDQESIAAFSKRKVGDRAYQYLVRTGIEPYWYFSCEEASAAMLMALQSVAATARFYTLKGGMDQVCQALFAQTEVRLETEVDKIIPSTEAKVELRLANGEQLHFDGVVLSTTASVAANLAADFPLPSSLQDFLKSQRYAANVNAYFFLDQAHLDKMPPQISGCGPDTQELAALAKHGSHTEAQTHPGKGILGIWLLDKASRSLLNAPKEKVTDYMWELARRYVPELPVQHEGLASLTRRAEAIPIHAPGRYKLASACWQEQKAPLVLAGDYLSTATMEGALQTGYWAAETLINHFEHEL